MGRAGRLARKKKKKGRGADTAMGFGAGRGACCLIYAPSSPCLAATCYTLTPRPLSDLRRSAAVRGGGGGGDTTDLNPALSATAFQLRRHVPADAPCFY